MSNPIYRISIEEWKEIADFLARQIVDDLYRAGIKDSLKYQDIVEKTINTWREDAEL
jgi:hypothetical protein